MNILFTGHRGFLGKELLPNLSTKYKMFTYEGDICDNKGLTNFVNKNSISKVIHAAAIVSTRFKKNTSEDLIQNLRMTLNVVNLKIPVLTFCSGKVYGYQDPINNVKEENAGDRYPEDYYGQAKYIIRKLIEDKQDIFIARFFNAFGFYESSERFIKANLLRYFKKEPMIVHRNVTFDFFYVEDSLPIITNWISGNKIPKETNLVYLKKLTLKNVCELINQLDNHKVDIITENLDSGKDYFGNGKKLSELGYPILGLEEGLRRVYEKIQAEQVSLL